ncbi:hypothetical protein ATCC90586_000603 [Pythium insidiosum]|nr:hypothetical protein ATCC90586_000603 [Pythium insidiosum]
MCLLDQEAADLQRRQRRQRTVSGSSSSSTTSSSTPTPRDRSTKRIVLTSSSSEREHVEALRSQLTVEPLPAAQCGLAQADGRRYPLFPEESPDTPMEVLPTPTTEAARLRAIRETQVRESPAEKAMGTRFYCGFPLVAEDATIIGAVCCIDQRSRELTESQYAVMKKLATTASKVLKVQTLQRRGSDAKQSQPPTPRQQQWRRTASVRAA